MKSTGLSEAFENIDRNLNRMGALHSTGYIWLPCKTIMATNKELGQKVAKFVDKKEEYMARFNKIAACFKEIPRELKITRTLSEDELLVSRNKILHTMVTLADELRRMLPGIKGTFKGWLGKK